MSRVKTAIIWLAAILACTLSANQDKINEGLVNSKVERKIDISSQLVKLSSSITLENSGSKATKSFLVAVEPSLVDHLSFAGASIKKDEGESIKLDVVPTSVAGHSDKTFYRVTLDKSLGEGASVDVDVDLVFVHALRAFPAQIAQSEKQFVEFVESVYFYSPYKTASQTTTVKMASSGVEFHTKVNPVALDEETITYGPYEDIAAFTQENLRVHYENNNPFLTVTHLERLIEVSHWGNIAIEETFDVVHSGATLKGSFSRYDYQRMQDESSSVKSFKTILPASAADVYYRDEIGNISTSNLIEHEDHVEVELRPRFPLFGGWKTHYYMGYNLPSYEYLFHSGNNHILKMRFLDHIFDDMIVDEMTLKIILPEGAKDIALKSPFEVRRSPNELHYTYLDTIGRPVIIAHKTNLVENHIDDFQLQYSFNKLLLLQEPLLVVGALYFLFLCVILIVRMDFSISTDAASEARMRVAGLVEELLGINGKRSKLYSQYDDAINKFKHSKDSSGFRATLKKLDGDQRTHTQAIQTIQSTLKTESSEVYEKVAELQKYASNLKELVQSSITNGEKVVNGKMSKQQYLDVDKTTTARRTEIFGKLEAVANTL